MSAQEPAAAALDLLGGGVVEQRDAVPQQVRLAERHEQRALADAEPRGGPDPGQALVVADLVGALGAQRRHRRPRLPGLGDVLARVLADRAAVRRGRARRVLDTAGHADEGLHSREPMPP
jgi:hypothetical protein